MLINKITSHVITYILLTKREGCRLGEYTCISAGGLDSADRAYRGPSKKDRGPIFSQYWRSRTSLFITLLKSIFNYFINIKGVKCEEQKMTPFQVFRREKGFFKLKLRLSHSRAASCKITLDELFSKIIF